MILAKRPRRYGSAHIFSLLLVQQAVLSFIVVTSFTTKQRFFFFWSGLTPAAKRRFNGPRFPDLKQNGLIPGSLAKRPPIPDSLARIKKKRKHIGIKRLLHQPTNVVGYTVRQFGLLHHIYMIYVARCDWLRQVKVAAVWLVIKDR